jgi:tetratricopeptide (TPR) repeat protein
MVAMIAAPLLALVLAQTAPAKPAATAPRAAAAGAQTAPKADPYARVQQAKAAFDAGQYPRVLQITASLLKDYPKSPSSHLLRAMALDELGRLDEADRSYQAALDASPGDPQILARYGMHHLRRDRWTDAIRCLDASVAKQPDPLSYFYLAQAYFHTDAKGKALDAIEKSAALEPRNPTILVKLGEYRAQANKFSPALEALKRAQQTNPKEPGLDLALGVVHLGLLEVDEARAALERALAADPDNLAALSSLAQACSKARDHAAARGYYQRLIDLGHRDAPYLLGLGAALLGLGENEAAITALTSAASANPELAEAHFHLARAYRAVGRAEDSQRELKTFQALKANPLQPFAERSDFERDLWRRAEALVVDGKEKAALELLAGGNVPGNQPEYLVGALYYKLGRYADAERLLSRALQVAPKLPKLRAYLGLALLEQGRVAEAEEAIQAEAEQNPREPFVLMAQGTLHYRKKEWKEAARYLQESKVVEPAVLLMLCEAQLESGQTSEARETAQLATTFAAGRPDVVESVKKLLARHQLTLEGSPSS